MTQSVNFEEALTDNDYGLIISKDGELKGIFIPDTLEEEAAVNDPEATLVTNKEVPPFWK